MNADEQERIMKQNDKDYGDWVCVVRCKDCKHYTEYIAYTKNFKSHYCSGGFVDSNMALHPDDYCSYGEKREEE